MLPVVVKGIRCRNSFVAEVVSSLKLVKINSSNWLIVWDICWEIIVGFEPFLMAVGGLRVRPEELKIKFYETLSFLVLGRWLKRGLCECIVVCIQNISWAISEIWSHLVVILDCWKMSRSNLDSCVQTSCIWLNCLKPSSILSVIMQVEPWFVIDFAIKFSFKAYFCLRDLWDF